MARKKPPRPPDLFDVRYPNKPGHVKGSDTSKEAAESVVSSAAAMRLKVKAYVGRHGTTGATCDEAECALSMRHQTASARLRELELATEIIKLDDKRKTRSGRNAHVYVLPEYVP